MTDEPARSATYFAVNTAKEAGAWIAYDPNYRAALWKDEKTARGTMRGLLPYVDLLKLSEEAVPLLTDLNDSVAVAQKLNEQKIDCVAITLGEDGVLVGIGKKTIHIPWFAVKAMDTTGAGDAFWGGFSYRMLEKKYCLVHMTLAEGKDCAVWGNTVAACCVQKHGGISAMPDRKTIERVIPRNGVNQPKSRFLSLP